MEKLEQKCSTCSQQGPSYSMTGQCTNCETEYLLVIPYSHEKPTFSFGWKCTYCGCNRVWAKGPAKEPEYGIPDATKFLPPAPSEPLPPDFVYQKPSTSEQWPRSITAGSINHWVINPLDLNPPRSQTARSQTERQSLTFRQLSEAPPLGVNQQIPLQEIATNRRS